MTMADTVAVMNKGRIEQMGAPEELYELPRTAFVANFLGQSNLFTGEVVGSTDRAITVEAGSFRIVVPSARSARTSGEVTIGVRPEKLLLLTEQPQESPDRNVLGPGRVVDVSFSGVSTQYTIEIPTLGSIVVFAQNMVFGPVVGEGAQVWVSWSTEHGFGLADEPGTLPRFAADDSTRAIALQKRGLLAGRAGGS